MQFDMRVYVVVTSVDPLRVYLFKDGLVRLATEPYVVPTAKNLAHTRMHLTNYAINKVGIGVHMLSLPCISSAMLTHQRIVSPCAPIRLRWLRGGRCVYFSVRVAVCLHFSQL